MHDPTDLVENALALAEATKRDRQHAAVKGVILRRVMSSDYGREFVADILERAGIFRISFDPESQRKTDFNEGRRNEGLFLYAQIKEHCNELWKPMEDEAAARIEAARKDSDS